MRLFVHRNREIDLMRRTLCVPILLALSAAMAYGQAAELPQTIEIRGETMQIWPAENLRARGLEVQEIPRDENAAWLYLDAINAYPDLPEDLQDAFDYALSTAWPEGQEGLTEWLKHEQSQKAFELVRKAAGMQRCQMPYFGDPNTSIIAVLLPNLSHMRFLAKAMMVESRRLAAEGKADEALANQAATMRMGWHAAQGMTLIEDLVGVAVWALASRHMTDMVARRDLSLSELSEARRALEDQRNHLPSARHGIRNEQRFGTAAVDEIASRPLRIPFSLGQIENFGVDGSNVVPADGWGRFEKRLGQLIFPDRTIKAHMSAYYDKLATRAEHGPQSATARDFDEEREINAIPRWDVVSRVLLPSLARATTLSERLQADYALARGVVAIRRYMKLHDGKAPETLDEAIAGPVSESLTDPFSGEPLQYRRTADGWVLYSIGPDLEDDGGEKGQPWDQYDLVEVYPPETVEPFGAEPQ